MSRAQLRNLATENIKRMADHGLSDWLPNVVSDVSRVEVGVWRCPVGEVTCPEGGCGGSDCECCEQSDLWESPLNGNDWEPECMYCGRKALLVEVVGVIDYSMLLAV
jgi:hypothetical protein